MAAPKFKPSDFSKLYHGSEEKKKIEALKRRLEELLINDQEKAKKAALVIEHWLKKSQAL